MAGVLLIHGSFTTRAQTSNWITKSQQDEILSEIQRSLPAGWVVTPGSTNRTPDDWYTLDDRGFQIDGVNGAQTFRTWILPKDWVGIRRVRQDRLRVVYWEGILVGQNFKSITNTAEESTHEALQQVLGNTTSLINSGWRTAQEIFKDKTGEIDKQAQMLVDRFCKDQACRDEAAYSLVVLGVPSVSVTLNCAEHGRGAAQQSCVSALGYLKGAESKRLLETLVAAPSTSPAVRKYAAASLSRDPDLSSAPALVEALRMRPSADTASYLIEALERLRYAPAAPEILYQLENGNPEDIQRGYYVRALATLRYKPAVPVIAALSTTKAFTADWILREHYQGSQGDAPAIALMRLIADWGASSSGVRLLVLPPEKLTRSGRNAMVVVIENTGDADLPILMGESPGALIVDGRAYPQGPMILDGNPYLGVNRLYPHAIDLSAWLADGRSHRIQYELGSASSNTVILQLPQN